MDEPYQEPDVNEDGFMIASEIFAFLHVFAPDITSPGCTLPEPEPEWSEEEEALFDHIVLQAVQQGISIEEAMEQYFEGATHVFPPRDHPLSDHGPVRFDVTPLENISLSIFNDAGDNDKKG